MGKIDLFSPSNMVNFVIRTAEKLWDLTNEQLRVSGSVRKWAMNFSNMAIHKGKYG